MSQISWILFLAILFIGCSGSETPTTQTSDTQARFLNNSIQHPKFDSIVSIDTMSTGSANYYLLQAQLSRVIEAEYKTILYRVYYHTTSYDGSSTPVSGLLAIPEASEVTKIIHLMSGTKTDRRYSPSAPDIFSSYPYSAVFAASGNIFVAADFIGLGQSQATPTYAHVASTSQAAQDLIDIALEAQTLLSSQDPEIYLIGISSGAAANVFLQAQLEKDLEKYPLVESANVSGPYQMSEIQSKFAIANNNNYFLGYIAYSYSTIYDIPLSELVQEEFIAKLPELYSGYATISTIQSELPSKSEDFLTASIIQSVEGREQTKFMSALQENDVANTTLTENMTLYYTTGDLTVDPQDTELTYEQMKDLGNPVTLIDLGIGSHRDAILASFSEIIKQFEL